MWHRAPRVGCPRGSPLAALTFGTAIWSGWREPTPTVDVPWAPAWGLRLSFALDGLALLYMLLASGIGLLVILYAARYIPSHLAHQHRPAGEIVRFSVCFLGFMGAMVGLAMAQDLVLLFVFWDVTAIASYYLIGYDRQHSEARAAALMAFLITGVTSICLLLGALLLQARTALSACPS